MKVAKAVDTVLGYVVLHRHGHRAPIRNLFEKNEIDLWCNLLPSSERLQQLSKSYPIQSHSGNVPPIDLKYKPLSCLTDLGVNHMISVGKKTNELFPLMNQSAKFQVFSTNYHRTQASAQSFLTGLGATQGTQVEVRTSMNCPMSFYEGRPDIAKQMTSKVQSFIEFQKEESEAVKSFGKDVAQILPNLIFSGSTSSPESLVINWMAALDYFACREGHSVPIDDRLQHLKTPVINYVSRRYRAYYSDPEHRSHSVNPILMDINTVLSSYQSQWTNQNISTPSAPYGTVVFSGHDVNLLGLLHGLNATIIDPSRFDQGGHWPDFGSLLIFELVSRNDVLGVNLYYNHEPLLISLNDSVAPFISLNDMTTLVRDYSLVQGQGQQ